MGTQYLWTNWRLVNDGWNGGYARQPPGDCAAPSPTTRLGHRSTDRPSGCNIHRVRCITLSRRGATQIPARARCLGAVTQVEVIRATHHPVTRGRRHVCPGPQGTSSSTAYIPHISLTRHATASAGGTRSKYARKMQERTWWPRSINRFTAWPLYPAATRQPLSWTLIGRLWRSLYWYLRRYL